VDGLFTDVVDAAVRALAPADPDQLQIGGVVDLRGFVTRLR
jgi:hypothetical protein